MDTRMCFLLKCFYCTHCLIRDWGNKGIKIVYYFTDVSTIVFIINEYVMCFFYEFFML